MTIVSPEPQLRIPTKSHLQLRVRIMCDDEPAMGPGKAMVLEAIRRVGSISGAGRDLGLSYRRVWLLVDSMNRCWREPLVEASPGGRGGAQLTELGNSVLRMYGALMERIEEAARKDDFAELIAQLRDHPKEPAAPSHPLTRQNAEKPDQG